LKREANWDYRYPVDIKNAGTKLFISYYKLNQWYAVRYGVLGFWSNSLIGQFRILPKTPKPHFLFKIIYFYIYLRYSDQKLNWAFECLWSSLWRFKRFCCDYLIAHHTCNIQVCWIQQIFLTLSLNCRLKVQGNFTKHISLLLYCFKRRLSQIIFCCNFLLFIKMIFWNFCFRFLFVWSSQSFRFNCFEIKRLYNLWLSNLICWRWVGSSLIWLSKFNSRRILSV